MPAIFVGRFQPFHKGHLQALKWILKKEKSVFLVVAADPPFFGPRNPFSFSERKQMITEVLRRERIKGVRIFKQGDAADDAVWVKEILEKVKKPASKINVYTRNPWTKNSFKKRGFEVKKHPLFFRGLSATKIREKIAGGKKWKSFVHPAVCGFILKKRGKEKMRKAYAL